MITLHVPGDYFEQIDEFIDDLKLLTASGQMENDSFDWENEALLAEFGGG